MGKELLEFDIADIEMALANGQSRIVELEARERELLESNSLYADAAQEMESTIASLAQALALARNWRPLVYDALEHIKYQREEMENYKSRADMLSRALDLACEQACFDGDCPDMDGLEICPLNGSDNDTACENIPSRVCWRIHFERLAGDE